MTEETTHETKLSTTDEHSTESASPASPDSSGTTPEASHEAHESGHSPEVTTSESSAEVAHHGESEAESSEASATEATPATPSETSASQNEEKGSANDQNEDNDDERDLPNINAELHKLVDLSTKYAEIGPIVISLATKLGRTRIAERVVRLGLEGDNVSMEYYFVAARLARSEGSFDEVLNFTLVALKSVLDRVKEGETIDPSDLSRLLHLVRLAFATLMFDLEDIRSRPEFTSELSKMLGELKETFGDDAFYHQLYAQSLWFSDENASEDEWEQAVKFGEPEEIWNSRGTWYKEASKNITAAEAAYRRGLEKTADSALLMHNLAQIIMDRAEASMRIDALQSATLLNEAEGYLRKARRYAHRRLMRGHVHESFDRLRKLKVKFDENATTPEVGDVLTGRVISTKSYGAFIVLPSGDTGLLHSSEIDHYWVEDATTRYNENDAVEVKVIDIEERRDGEGLRISLSRKALIEKPADFDESLAKPPRLRGEGADKEKGERRRGRRRGGNSSGRRQGSGRRSGGGNRGGGRNGGRRERSPQQYRDSGTAVTIADLLNAKINRQTKEDE